jgi:hypothetical protein
MQNQLSKDDHMKNYAKFPIYQFIETSHHMKKCTSYYGKRIIVDILLKIVLLTFIMFYNRIVHLYFMLNEFYLLTCMHVGYLKT